MVTLIINGQQASVRDGTTVAAAILAAGYFGFHRSVSGEFRGPLCGMGICFECRVTIDGVPHQRSCNILVRDEMEVVTDE